MSFYEEISANRRMTWLLFVIFFFIIVALGTVISIVMENLFFVPLFGVIAIIYILISYYRSDSIVTAVSGAKPANESKFRQLYNIVDEMSIAAGIPKPRVYVIEDSAINAFATGRDPKHSIICVTTGAVDRLSREELTGVVGHEMSHIRNQDIKVMTMAAILVGLTVLLSDLILRMFLYGGSGGNSREGKGGAIFIIAIVVGVILAILTPIIAQIINFAISRKREYLADASGAELTRYPPGLASALRKIADDKEPLEAANKATAHLYIANPLKGQKLWMQSLFDTHPPIESRIQKLLSM
ncbi:MAG: M48 family metallopeptidase [Candidatus Diapherotrites archaeon]|nr:M48 family metallopeptidase [Candidatus Diapherotrites archaeon]